MQGIRLGWAVAVWLPVWLPAWLPAWAAAQPPAAGPRILTTAGQIAAEVTPPDARPAGVRFEGPVFYQDVQRTIFVADQTGVTFIYSGTNPIVQPGDLVRVAGSAHEGLLIGGIRPERIEVIGRGEPPPAAPVEPADLATGRYHYHRVVIPTGTFRASIDPTACAAGSPVAAAAAALLLLAAIGCGPRRPAVVPDGRFSLGTFAEADGCVPGTHGVEVIGPLPGGGETVAAVPEPAVAVPARYREAATSGLTITVTGPTSDLAITLSTGK